MDVLYTKEEDRIQFNNVATPLSEQCEFRNSREGIGKTLSRICSSLCSHIFVLSTGEDRMLNERKRIESILGEGPARREGFQTNRILNYHPEFFTLYFQDCSYYAKLKLFTPSGSYRHVTATPNWLDSEQLENYGHCPYFLRFQNDVLDLGKIKVGAIPKGGSPC